MRHGLDEFVTTLHLFRAYRCLLYLLPGYWSRKLDKSRGQRLREALEELGPIFVKFGQLLSTRPDLIPDDICSFLIHGVIFAGLFKFNIIVLIIVF